MFYKGMQELLEKLLANYFALSDAEDKQLISGGIADLSLLRTLFAIRQKLWGLSFWEVILSSFISIRRFGSFKSPVATLQVKPFKFKRRRKFILLVHTKEKVGTLLQFFWSKWILYVKRRQSSFFRCLQRPSCGSPCSNH